MAVKHFLVGVAFLAALLAAMAQTPAQTTDSAATTSSATISSAKTSSAQILNSGAIVVELAKAVNSRKAKVDDRLEGKLTMDLLSHGQIVIPRGTRIVGHLTDVRARSKTVTESMLKIVFDRVVLKNGREIPFTATIQAVGTPMQTSAADVSDVDFASQMQSRPSLGRNEMKQIQATAYPGSRRPANAEGGVEEADTGPHRDGPALGPFSQGVVGMKGITLSNTAQGSAISSTSENVHLSTGTQLVLHVTEPEALVDSVHGANR
jgi:hypothetical protein